MKTYIPSKDLSNAILHAPIKYHLTFLLNVLMVESQTPNFILHHFSSPNLCFKSLHGKCDLVLDSYYLKFFQ
jgi:hypothetical protein